MFEAHRFSKPLDDDQFEAWLQKGRDSKIGYQYLLIVWHILDEEYRPIYFENRTALNVQITAASNITEEIVAAYDLYSESKISLA